MGIRKRNEPRVTAFVAMPFAKRYRELYELGIKNVCQSKGIHPLRLDDEVFSGQIIQRIHQGIQSSHVVIAELSERNPNVYYEVGYAQALGKPAIYCISNAKLIPFDLASYRHIVYGRGLTLLREQLAMHLDQIVGSIPSGPLSFFKAASDLQHALSEHIEACRSGMVFSGTHFGIVFSERRALLLRKLRAGVDLTVQVLAPESKLVERTAETYRMDVAELRAECRTGLTAMRNFGKELAASAGRGKGRFRVHFHQRIPRARFYAFDQEDAAGRLFHVPYIDGLRSSHSPGHLYATHGETGRILCGTLLEGLGAPRSLRP